jgi:cytochrome c556
MKTFTLIAGSFALAAGLIPFAASAQFAKPEDAIKYRQSALAVQGRHFGLINATVKGDRPFDAAQVTRDAEIVAMMSSLPWTAFGAGTEGGKAKPEIWKESADFKKKSEDLQAATAKLVVAAKGGKMEDIRAAFGATGQTCKACHDEYRSK